MGVILGYIYCPYDRDIANQARILNTVDNAYHSMPTTAFHIVPSIWLTLKLVSLMQWVPSLHCCWPGIGEARLRMFSRIVGSQDPSTAV